MKQLIQKIRTLFKSTLREQEPRTNPFADKLTDREFEAIINYVRATLTAEQNTPSKATPSVPENSTPNGSMPVRDELLSKAKKSVPI